MAGTKQFKLPDVGEGLTEAEIVSWKVKPGDTVKVNDVIVEIETAKSLVELPCPFAGTVSELLVDEGSTVDVGTPIIAVETAGGVSATAPSGTDGSASGAVRQAPGTTVPRPPDDMSAGIAANIPTPDAEGAVEPGLIGGPAPGGRTSVLVGYGPRTTEAKRRPRKAGGATPSTDQGELGQRAVQTTLETAPEPVSEPPVEQAPAALPSVEDVAAVPSRLGSDGGGEAVVGIDGGGAAPVGGTVRVLAKPPVRMLAKSLGVDLGAVTPSGPGGIVTRADVLEAAEGAKRIGASSAAVAQREAFRAAPEGPQTVPDQRQAEGARETRIPVKGVRKMTAQAMVSSAFTAPHVTEWVTVDVTRTMRLVDRLREDRSFADVKVSPLLVLAKAMLLAIRRNPGINAAWDEAAQEIVVKHYVNLGIAAATPRGLVVPNIKDAQRMSLRELGEAMRLLVSTAREGRTPPGDMQGGTITITNVGVFGVDAGTPILNQGEAAILCFGQVREQPWVHKGKVKPRLVTQLALSFDHRLVDGDLGSRFLADVARLLEHPEQALVWA